MSKSITLKIFALILSSILALLIIISFTIRFFLPDYYMDQKLKTVDNYMEKLAEAVDQPTELTNLIIEIETSLGGQVDIIDQSGNQRGYGKGKNASGNMNNTYSIPEDQTESFNSEYTNKYGVHFKVYGFPIDDNWILYQLPITSIDDTISVFTDFYNYIILFGVILAVLIAMFVSKSVTEPILSLNEETKALIDNGLSTLKTINRSDEIGQLNHSIHYLYKSLQSNIQRLDAELESEKKADILRKEFLAQVSHELKTPMAVIKGYAEIIMDGLYKDEAKLHQFIENIYNETEHVDKLLLDITDYSKMASGHFEIQMKETKITEWLLGLTDKMKPFIESEGKNFKSTVQTNDFSMALDEHRMEQVIKILLNNAIEHSRSSIDFKVYDENNHLVIVCENDGQQISDQDLPFIFNSFYKKKGKQKGSGLGLAILKEIVIKHQGSYHVENTDEGVKFTVII